MASTAAPLWLLLVVGALAALPVVAAMRRRQEKREPQTWGEGADRRTGIDMDRYEADMVRQLATGTVVGMELGNCPEQRCHMPTEVVHRFTLSSTFGPVEHVALRCVDQHQFVMPADGPRIAS